MIRYIHLTDIWIFLLIYSLFKLESTHEQMPSEIEGTIKLMLEHAVLLAGVCCLSRKRRDMNFTFVYLFKLILFPVMH